MVASFLRLVLAVNCALAVSGLVIPRVPSPAAAAAAPTGTQFITGPCTSDADCASGCCGAKTGVCNARAVAEGPGGGGCGGSIAAAAPPAAASPAAAPAGTQFITGPCTSDADCASGCCGAKTGVCNARAVAEGPGGGGCGGPTAAAAPPAAAAPAAASTTAAAATPTGTQFITGPCTSDADCASGCCGAKTGVCNARAVAEGPGGGGCGGSTAAAAPPAAAAPVASSADAASPAAPAASPTGTQFITGPCTSDADCASGCCGAKTGVCNARAVAEGPGGGGCGGSAAAAAPPAAAPPAAASTTAAAATPTGTQFITGPCTSDADCASGCCGAKTGVCNARAVAEGPGGGGCGGFTAAAAPPAAAAPAAASTTAAAATPTGTQFITGPCTNDADCASGCCGAKTGVCNARAVAEGPTGGGCGGKSTI